MRRFELALPEGGIVHPKCKGEREKAVKINKKDIAFIAFFSFASFILVYDPHPPRAYTFAFFGLYLYPLFIFYTHVICNAVRF